MRRHPRLISALAALLALPFVYGGCVIVISSGDNERDKDKPEQPPVIAPAVITAENARLRLSPFDSATDSGVVKNGKMVNLTDTYKGYVFVKTENGKSGWLPKKAVSEILPTDENHQPQSSPTSSEIGKMNGSGGESKLKKT